MKLVNNAVCQQVSIKICFYGAKLYPATLNIPNALILLALHFASRRICSNPDICKLRTNELIDYLANRGYNKIFLKIQKQRASEILRTDALANKPKTQTETTPFVVTYNPALPNLAHIIHKHSNVLYP